MSEALITALVSLIDSRIAAHSKAAAHVQAQQAQAQQPQAQQAQAQQPQTPAAINDPFGLGMTAGTAAPATPPPVEVTPKMLTELIMPLLSNEAAKQRLQQAMHSMGISELPAARPDQLPELYTKFKAIADEVNGAAGAAPATAGGGVTII